MLVSICCLATLVLLLTFRLGTITPGFTEAELQQRAHTATTTSIVSNPLHLHQKVGQFILQKLDHKGPAAMRAPSVLMGLTAIVCMYIVLKNWYTTRVAVLGAFLFATSSWQLHFSRLATPEINFLMPLLLLVGSVWMHRDKFMMFAPVLTLISGILMLYTPGMIWFVFLIFIWRRRLVKRVFKRLSAAQQVGTVLVSVLALAPLVWAFALDTGLITSWLGFPETWPRPLAYLSNLVSIPRELFIRGAADPVYSIGHLPLLDVFTSCMVLLGIFVFYFKLGLDRTRLLFGAGAISILLVALDGPVAITLLLPIVYILASGGIALLLQQWFTVFPRNPVARALGVVLISSTVLLSAGYHLSHYFVAWPNVPDTKASFSHQP